MNASKRIYQTLSPLVAGRVFPILVPESAKASVDGKSYIIYTKPATHSETSLDGYEGHEYVTFQIDVYSYTYADAENLMIQVMNALNTIKADVGSRQDIPDPNPKLFRQSLDCQVWGTTY